MKNYFSYIGIFILISFSFYYTDKVSELAYNNNKLVKQIKEAQVFYNKDAKNAQINFQKNTIIPGLYGKKIDITESYLNMSDFKSFNDNYLIYHSVKPKKSLEDHKEKFIISGNKNKRNVSIIINNNEKVKKYFNRENIKYSYISSDTNNYDNIINTADNKTDFKLLNRFIKKSNRFCLKGFSNIDLCKKYGYYLISTNIFLNNYNLSKVKSKLASGSIILIDKNVSLDNVLLILRELEFKDLKIVSLKRLISERD